MESGVTELRCSSHCGFNAIVYTIGDVRNLEILWKMVVQRPLAQTKLVLIQDSHYAFFVETIGGLTRGLVTFRHVLQNCIGNVLFAPGRRMSLWVGSHVEVVPPMFAALLENV